MLRIGVILIVAVLLAVTAIWIFQERLVFLPPAVPAAQGRGAERVDYTAADGQQLFGFVTGVDSAPSPLLIVFHGNADLADSWINWAREVARRTNWRVLLAEYRGYGGLRGRPTYEGVMHDARAALAYARDHLGVASNDVALYGHSVGAGVAAQLAVEVTPRAVLLEAPPTSIVAMGQRSYPPPISWLLPLISRVHFAPVDRTPEIDAPVWVALGERDNVVPPRMGRTVFERAKRAGELLIVEHAGHGDVSSSGGEAYWAWLERALLAGPARE